MEQCRRDAQHRDVQASRNLDNSSEKKNVVYIFLIIILGLEAAKLSPMETLIENLKKKKKLEHKETHTQHTQRK